jgi:hypothetical protein
MISTRAFIACLLLMLSTATQSNDRDVVIYFDFQTGFTGQSIKLVVDGKDLLEKDGVKSNPSIGLALQYVYRTNAGSKRIVVIVNGKETLKQELRIETDTYIGIMQSGADSLLMISKKPFLYD